MGVLNVGPAELMMIIVVALLVFGPTRLPEIARQMGKAMSEFRRMSAGFQSEMRGALNEISTEVTPKPPLAAAPESGSANGTGDHATGATDTPPLSPPA